LPQKKNSFLRLFHSFRNNFVEEIFPIRALFRRENSIFYNNTIRSGLFPPKKPEQPLFLNFQIEFSWRKRARQVTHLS
jgi:hypothetical protein